MTRPIAANLLPLLMGAALLASCNMFEPVFSDGDDVELLIEDARYARAAGDYPRAVRLLEEALLIDASHPIVRFELAATLMRRDRLDLLALERVTAHLLDSRTDAGATAGRSGPGGVCTFDGAATTEAFDPRQVQDFDQIAGGRPSLLRVVELLNEPSTPAEAPAMPTELTSLDICQVIGSGSLTFDRPQVLNALLNQFESEEQVTGALAANAVALTLTSYVQLFEQPDLAVNWFVVNGAGVGACVPESHFELFLERARAAVGRAGQALISLDLLLHHTGNAQFEGVLDDAVEFYNTLESDEVNPCYDPT